MNEKIRELAEQANEIVRQPASYTDDIKDGYRDVVVFNKEKFAESIIKECVEAIRAEMYWSPEGMIAASFLLEQFGVEE